MKRFELQETVSLPEEVRSYETVSGLLYWVKFISVGFSGPLRNATKSVASVVNNSMAEESTGLQPATSLISETELNYSKMTCFVQGTPATSFKSD